MLRTVIFAFLHCLMTGNVVSQNIHTIIFASTSDVSIGAGCAKNSDSFESFTSRVARGLGIPQLRNTPKKYVGLECSSKSYNSFIESFECKSEDIVFFAYFGHGAPTSQSEFPLIGFHKDYVSIPLEDVKRDLIAKGAKFVFVMGDCCNGNTSDRPRASKKYGTDNIIGTTSGLQPQLSVNFVQADSSEPRVLKQLFGQAGSLIASGCRRGESSWYGYGYEGGYFTNGFMEGLDEYISQNPIEPSWDALMEIVRKRVREYSTIQLSLPGNIKKAKGQEEQTPIWQSITHAFRPISKDAIQNNGKHSVSELLNLLKSSKQSDTDD